ncbi:MAG TPA: GH116 family glycosyl-hydrolase [Phycisphaerae bacterium]|nr:GH116 family glycosyl-hydrolase [Phycisphaerae bacterium]
MRQVTNPDWPVLTRYQHERLRCIAMPLGGIGTGTVSLGGRGDLRDWEIVNRPAKGFSPRNAFFALWARPAGGRAITRAIEGAIAPPYEGPSGCRIPNHGLPRFRRCSFAAAYPLAQVLLSDRDVPLDVRIEAFNPLVPGDADASGMPVAVLRFVLVNKTARTVQASVCGSMENFIGRDGAEGASSRNVNEFRRGRRLHGILMRSDGVDRAAEQFGTIALATTAAAGVSHRIAWARLRHQGDLLDFWDDFSADGRLAQRRPADEIDAPTAALAVRLSVPARGTRAVTLLLSWHFPNRHTWTPLANAEPGQCCAPGGRHPDWVGNYYTTRYADAWAAAEDAAARLAKLEDKTVKFVRAVCESDVPAVVKEAALCNLTALRSQTCFRTADGRFFGWEGCHDRSGCCWGSCTHVWNYEHASALLFGELACSMREVEFAHATDDRGLMSFRVSLPLERARQFGIAAADGQMGTIMRLYREWQLSGDEGMLRRLWPAARRAMEFAWIPGGWDADHDGVMEGCQHNTMDVEYYGPNGEINLWYLGALRACERMARHLGEADFADTCRDLFTRGSRWTDENLFNGEYYEHKVVPPGDPSAIAPGLRHGMGADDLARPQFQLGPACLADQLVGQLMAHVCGLGYLVAPDHARKALRSIMKHNFRKDLHGHFNHVRTYAMNDEAGLLIASYPRGSRPKEPFFYCNEVWTGLEYTAAAGMIHEGLITDAVRCVAAARARHDGARRNPFDEPECGHHYARAMASWSLLPALSGFGYSGVEKTIRFAARRKGGRVFWSNGYAWGTCAQQRTRTAVRVELAVLHGALAVRRLVLSGFGEVRLARPRTLKPGRPLRVTVRRASQIAAEAFDTPCGRA